MTVVEAAVEAAGDSAAVQAALITARASIVVAALGLVGVVMTLVYQWFSARAAARKIGDPVDSKGNSSTVADQVRELTGHVMSVTETMVAIDHRVDVIEQVQLQCGVCPRRVGAATAAGQ